MCTVYTTLKDRIRTTLRVAIVRVASISRPSNMIQLLYYSLVSVLTGILLAGDRVVTSFQLGTTPQRAAAFVNYRRVAVVVSMSDDWSSFQAIDDDDDVLGSDIDTREYAVEEDSQETKASVGASFEAPEIERDAEPIMVPAGMYVVRLSDCLPCFGDLDF